ncbi:MAG: DUF4255 domain-containing protein [Roseobacter sp.]
MPVPASSLSEICDNVRSVLSTGIDAATNGIGITMGAPGALDTFDENQVNLFFYRFEPSGFDAQTQPDLPWRIRMFCMITPFGIDEVIGDGSSISAGENDMRLLGDVMRVLHEQPILPPIDADGIEVRTRVVFMPSSDEQINQIWSTQGDVHYRPSAVFEMALTPIVPRELMPEPAIVGAIGSEVRLTADKYAPFDGVITGPRVAALTVDTDNPAWRPAIVLIWQDGVHRSLSFDVEGAEFAGFTPQVWIAGDPGTDVDLVWQIWRSSGWQTVMPAQNAMVATQDIDPMHIPLGLPGLPVATALPDALAAEATSLQLMLCATRTFERFPGAAPEILRSDPILITLWREAP